MYIPKHFEVADMEVSRDLIRAHPLATIVTKSADGLNANHVPLLFSPDPAPFGILRGHVARANPMWQEEGDVLAIFHGPEAYISPSWYPTKAEAGRVVPTWNYAVVHAYGVLRSLDDPEWLRQQLNDLTTQSEADFRKPWAVSDAPSDYVESLIEAIVGIEIVLTKVVGKWKASQNQPERNQKGAVEGLRERGDTAMSNLVSSQLSKNPDAESPLN